MTTGGGSNTSGNDNTSGSNNNNDNNNVASSSNTGNDDKDKEVNPLLLQIQQGMKLRKVTPPDDSPVRKKAVSEVSGPTDGGGIMGMLSRAITGFRSMLREDSDTESESGFSNDDNRSYYSTADDDLKKEISDWQGRKTPVARRPGAVSSHDTSNSPLSSSTNTLKSPASFSPLRSDTLEVPPPKAPSRKTASTLYGSVYGSAQGSDASGSRPTSPTPSISTAASRRDRIMEQTGRANSTPSIQSTTHPTSVLHVSTKASSQPVLHSANVPHASTNPAISPASTAGPSRTTNPVDAHTQTIQHDSDNEMERLQEALSRSQHELLEVRQSLEEAERSAELLRSTQEHSAHAVRDLQTALELRIQEINHMQETMRSQQQFLAQRESEGHQKQNISTQETSVADATEKRELVAQIHGLTAQVAEQNTTIEQHRQTILQLQRRVTQFEAIEQERAAQEAAIQAALSQLPPPPPLPPMEFENKTPSATQSRVSTPSSVTTHLSIPSSSTHDPLGFTPIDNPFVKPPAPISRKEDNPELRKRQIMEVRAQRLAAKNTQETSPANPFQAPPTTTAASYKKRK